VKPLSQALGSIPRSGIRVIMDMAVRVPGCIRLVAGEPNFPTPPHIVEAANQAAREGHTKYTDNSGIIELRQCVAERISQRAGRPVGDDQVIVTPGAVAALFTTLMAIVDPGDEVIVVSPAWPNYVMQIQLVGARPVTVITTEATGYVPTVGQLEAAVSDRTKAIIINSPSNPTGAVFSEEGLDEILCFARAADIYVISDEVYEEVVYELPHVSATSHDPDGRVVGIFSLSKSYAMTGWRVGYAVAPEHIAPHIRKCQEPTVSCVNAPAQYAALAALTGPQDAVVEMRNAYRDRRDNVHEILASAGVPALKPGGAFYMWVDIGGAGKSDIAFSTSLIENRQVAVVPGSTFGPANTERVRISLATAPDELYEGVHRLVEEIKS